MEISYLIQWYSSISICGNSLEGACVLKGFVYKSLYCVSILTLAKMKRVYNLISLDINFPICVKNSNEDAWLYDAGKWVSHLKGPDGKSKLYFAVQQFNQECQAGVGGVNRCDRQIWNLSKPLDLKVVWINISFVCQKCEYLFAFYIILLYGMV